MNVLLIVTDSTRRDFVSVYDGDERADTPNLDALAQEGLRFDRAVPEAMPTVAVRRAILTGTRSFPFRDWKVAPKLPQFPGWSTIPATSGCSRSTWSRPASRRPTSPTTLS